MIEHQEHMISQTLVMYRLRLERIAMCIDAADKEHNGVPITTRMHKLSQRASDITNSSPARSGIHQLLTKHPDLFTVDEPAAETKLATILADAPAYPATASQLRSLVDQPVPPTESFTSLVALSPHIAQVRQRQAKQEQEIFKQLKRSIEIIRKWHEIQILGQGRCWAEWHGRLLDAERAVRMEEVERACGGPVVEADLIS